MKISYKYYWISTIVNYKLEEINNVYNTAHKVILKSVSSYKLLLLVWILKILLWLRRSKKFLAWMQHKLEASIWNPVTQACALGECVKEPQDSGKKLENTN